MLSDSCLGQQESEGRQERKIGSQNIEYEHVVPSIPTCPRAQETRMVNIVSSNPSLFLHPTHWGCDKTTIHLTIGK